MTETTVDRQRSSTATRTPIKVGRPFALGERQLSQFLEGGIWSYRMPLTSDLRPRGTDTLTVGNPLCWIHARSIAAFFVELTAWVAVDEPTDYDEAIAYGKLVRQVGGMCSASPELLANYMRQVEEWAAEFDREATKIAESDLRAAYESFHSETE